MRAGAECAYFTTPLKRDTAACLKINTNSLAEPPFFNESGCHASVRKGLALSPALTRRSLLHSSLEVEGNFLCNISGLGGGGVLSWVMRLSQARGAGSHLQETHRQKQATTCNPNSTGHGGRQVLDSWASHTIDIREGLLQWEWLSQTKTVDRNWGRPWGWPLASLCTYRRGWGRWGESLKMLHWGQSINHTQVTWLRGIAVNEVIRRGENWGHWRPLISPKRSIEFRLQLSIEFRLRLTCSLYGHTSVYTA